MRPGSSQRLLHLLLFTSPLYLEGWHSRQAAHPYWPQCCRTGRLTSRARRRRSPVRRPLRIGQLEDAPIIRQAEQMVDVGFDHHSLPHILLGLLMLGIEGLFFFYQLSALFFQHVHGEYQSDMIY